MTVSNTTAKLQYAGDGTTRTFGITFPLLSADHLRVVVTDASGTDTTITNNYTLSDELNSITYPTEASELDPLPEGYKITLIRQTPLTQQIDLHSAHALDAEELERGYDKLTLLVQELKEQLARCIQYAATNTTEHAAEQFLSDVETAASNAASSASAAASSATSAAGSATTASNAATQAGAAKDVATSAATSAGNAKDLALEYKAAAATSAGLASNAQDAAETAQAAAEAVVDVVDGYKDDAAGYASAAGESALAAATSESNASGYATAASNSKTAAQQAANAAASAKTDAESAATSAQTAAAQLDNHNTDPEAHEDIRQEIDDKQDKLVAGDNIQINGNVISATGGGGGGGSTNWGSIGGTLANQTDLANALAGKADASHTHTKSEITDFPTIPSKVSDLTNDSGFITSSDIPAIPTKTSDLQNDSGFITGVAWADVSGKPSTFTPSSHTHTKSEITDFPTIPSKTSQLTNDSGFITDVAVATTSAAGKVKPDGTTITVAADGTISAAGGSGGGITATYDSTNKILTLE